MLWPSSLQRILDSLMLRGTCIFGHSKLCCFRSPVHCRATGPTGPTHEVRLLGVGCPSSGFMEQCSKAVLFDDKCNNHLISNGEVTSRGRYKVDIT